MVRKLLGEPILRKSKSEPLTPWYHEDDLSPVPFNTAPFRWAAIALYLMVFAVMAAVSPLFAGAPLIGYGVFTLFAVALYWSTEKGYRDVALLWACGIWVFAIMMFLPMWLDWTRRITAGRGSLFQEILIPHTDAMMLLALAYAVVGVVIVRCNRWYHALAHLCALFCLFCLWALAQMVIRNTWL